MFQRKRKNNFPINNNSEARLEYDEDNEDIPFYHYSKFENVKLINENVKNVYKAHIKRIVSQQEKTAVEIIALKYISLNNLINEVKRHRKLETNGSILKFYGITKHEYTDNYMIALEYANNGTLRQYLKTNSQKFDWNIKLNLAKQIANALMNLHDNNIIHGKLTSESILVHNETIKLNDFSINYLKSLTTTVTIPIQYTDFRYLELFNKSLDIYSLGIILWEITNDGISPFERESITKSSLLSSISTNNNIIDLINDTIVKLKGEKTIPGIPPKYKEIYTVLLTTSESILVHNETIKLNDFSINYLKSLTTTVTIPIQYTDFRYLELFNKSLDIYSLGIILWEITNDGISPFERESITKSSLLSSISTNNNIIDLINDTIVKLKGEKTIPGIPPKYKEIYTDCLERYRNSRPYILEIVNDLSEINIISDLNSKNEFEKSNEEEIPSPKEMRPTMIKNYIREHNLNPVKILLSMIRYPSHYWFTSLIGFFYQYGIGTVIDNQMAFKFFDLALNERIYMKNISSDLSLRKFYNINKEIGIIRLAYMYLHGIGVEKDLIKGFQIYSKAADEGSNIALNCVAHCYHKGFGVEKNEEKAFELYLKSAEKGNNLAQFNVNQCYKNGIGIAKDEVKGFQLHLKSALAGNINAINTTGYCYDTGIGVRVDKIESFKWYFKGAKKGYPRAQHNLGLLYKYGHGINQDQVKAFEWYKKAAENDHIKSQYAVGKYFYEGRGTRKDIIKAIYWLNKAKENGNINANTLLEESCRGVDMLCKVELLITLFEVEALKCISLNIFINEVKRHRKLEINENFLNLDIYSLGIILWKISNDGISPFERDSITKLSLPSSTSSNNNIIDLINDTIIKEKREKTIPEIPSNIKKFILYHIGTVINSQMAFKFFNLAANERIYKQNIYSNLLLRKFYDINKEIGIIHLAHMYFYDKGFEKDLKKDFQINPKAADEGPNIALNSIA
ncbi:hypothetical protein Glove_350g99 [Diversispora epigaea]|uniref:Protein kinase domain-containing protein n=1 Tax=Diversispora epigaea TaxID=1348612 RepID=A0A397HKG6_9GLOM|nr:hypothetical protein Glove_350g99 [Diversispora epigaea]